MSSYTVIVGNIGTVYAGSCSAFAHDTFRDYKSQSKSGIGAASGEPVTLMEDGEILEEHIPDPFRNSFMKPYIYQGSYFEVDTTHGTEIVPQDVSGDVTDISELEQYLEGKPLDDSFAPKSGWLARMSASGYTDCTEWTAHKTEQEAREYLIEMYGE